MPPNSLPAVLLVTDGSCLRNPGPGGWAALLQSDGHERVLTDWTRPRRPTGWN